MERETHTIDIAGKSLGRAAAQIASLLRGKQKITFAAHIDGGDFVVVKNAEKMKITGKKLEQKKYYRHSKYPGGLKEKTMKEFLAQSPQELVRRTVKGMIPPNRLRDIQIKRLQFAT